MHLFIGPVIAPYYTAAFYVCESDNGQHTHFPYIFLSSNKALRLFFVWPPFREMSMTRPVLLNAGGMNLSGQPFDGSAGCIVDDGLRLPPGR